MSNKLGVALVGAMLTANVAWAGSQFEDTVSQSTAINRAAMTLRGVHQANEPFLIQVFAAAGECLRLDVDSQTQDMAMLLATTSVNFGIVNDDRDFAGGDLRPLIVVDPVPFTGWYTVAVSYFDFDPRVAKFVLKYGRYPGGNPNCQVAASESGPALERLGGNPSK